MCRCCGEPPEAGHHPLLCQARLDASTERLREHYDPPGDAFNAVRRIVQAVEASERELLDHPPWATRMTVESGYPRIVSWGRSWGRTEAMRKAEARTAQRLELACQRALGRRGLAGLGFGLATSHGAPASPGYPCP